jgi:hypothetical protein
MILNDNITLGEAKALLRKELKKGADCPCCNRHTQLYSRKITSSMAYALILIYNEGHVHAEPSGFIHLENMFKLIPGLASSVRGDAPKLRFWGLIEPKDESADDGNPSSGLYRITDQGKLFVEGKVLIHSHINVYNNKMYGFSREGADVNIRQALKDKFNYNELMGKEAQNV